MDSRFETAQHIFTVQRFLGKLVAAVQRRLLSHDQTKLVAPEVEHFDRATEKLSGTTYGSPEYKAGLEEIKPAILHHHQFNRHHPEHTRALNEKWCAISGYENIYDISNFGDVRSKYKDDAGKILKPHITPHGYARIQLTKDGENQNVFIHRLVADAFIPNPHNKSEVNHKNGNKLDNYEANLEWVTSSENLQHAYDTGLKKANIKYIVVCNELDIVTLGVDAMEKQLRLRGYDKARASAIYNCITGNHKTHLDLTFTSYNVIDYQMPSDIRFMTLIDLAEMIADWKAASLRHADGDIRRSLEVNQQRFGYSDELKQILANTVELLEQE